MAERPNDLNEPIGDPPSRKTDRTEKEETAAAGKRGAENDAPGKSGDDEETMPIEEGFSIVP